MQKYLQKYSTPLEWAAIASLAIWIIFNCVLIVLYLTGRM